MTSLVLGVTTAGGRPWMNLPTVSGFCLCEDRP
jgi:hypothetical protein